MRTRDIEFFSDGIRLAGTLYLPEGEAPSGGHPGVVACSGYLGLNAIYPALFAGPLTEAGFAVLGFDYRGTGESDGEAGRLLIHEEGRDIAAGVTFLGLQEEVDAERVALVAWGMGVGCATPLVAGLPEVRALVALNGFYNGLDFLRQLGHVQPPPELAGARHQAPEDLAALEIEAAEDRARRVRGEKGAWVPPFHVYPLDPATAEEVQRNLEPVEHFGPHTALELADSILALDLYPLAPHLGTPVFVGHGRDNALHPPEQARRFYEAAADPREYREVPGRHNDFMQAENPVYQALMADVIAWLRPHLA